MEVIERLRDITWGQYQQMSLQEQGACMNRGSTPYHGLLSQQFSKNMINELCDLATNVRKIAKSKAGMRFLNSQLDHKRAMLYFSQPSSRTFLSFYAACQILGIEPAEVRDASTSSEMKGETPEDSVRTFSSYFDLLIMRTPLSGFTEKMAWLLSHTDRPVPIVNAGSGKDQHPTQALLDIYTLKRSFERMGGISGKRVAFVGDLARGRTARSLSHFLSLYDGVKQYFIAPPQLQIGSDILEQLDAAGVEYEVCHDFEKVMPELDAVYMTRIQDEWDNTPGESRAWESEAYHLRGEHLGILKNTAVIMHPLPRRKEIAVEIDSDPRAMYWRQMRNGMWVRVALIAAIFRRAADINKYYDDCMR